DHGLRGDTSTELTCNAVAQGKHLAFSFVTCNHFDIDGYFAVLCCVEPAWWTAVKRRDVVVAAARLGDFREGATEPRVGDTALRVCCLINSLERKHFRRPFEGDDGKFDFFLQPTQIALVKDVVDGRCTHEHLYSDEYRRVLADLGRIQSVAHHRDIGLVVVHASQPLHYYALFSDCRGCDTVLAVYPGDRFEIEHRYTTFVDLTSRPVLPRVCLSKLKVADYSAERYVDSGPLWRRDAKLTKAQRYGHPFERDIAAAPRGVKEADVMRALTQLLAHARGRAQQRWTWAELAKFNKRAPSAGKAFCNASLDTAARVEALLDELDLEAQLGLFNGASPGAAPPRPGLQLKELVWDSTCVHGVAPVRFPFSAPATVYPHAIAQGATWDPELVETLGRAIAREARELSAELERRSRGRKYGGIMCDGGPLANLAQDPRWGRIAETYGEDPGLVGTLAAAATRGLQNRYQGFYETAQVSRHLLGYHQARPDLPHGGEETVDDAAYLHDVLLRPFRAVHGAGGALGLMCAMSSINNVPSCASRDLLEKVLNGTETMLVQTDCCDSITAMVDRHNFVATLEEAVAAAVRAGVSVSYSFAAARVAEAFRGALRQGLLDASHLRDAARKVLRLRFALGEFEPVEPTFGPEEHDSRAKRLELARRVATRSFVLLKNERATLPLQYGSTVGLLGPFANCTSDHRASYGGKDCYLHSYHGEPTRPRVETLVDQFENPSYVLSCKSVEACDVDAVRKIVRATPADTILLAMGLGSTIEREGRDRTFLELPPQQVDLVDAALLAKSRAQRTVLLIHAGGPVTIPEHQLKALDAVMVVWYGGQEHAAAVKDTLMNNNGASPTGHLPVTMYRQGYLDRLKVGISDLDARKSVGRTTAYLREPAQFPFGFGLGGFDPGTVDLTILSFARDRVVLRREDQDFETPTHLQVYASTGELVDFVTLAHSNASFVGVPRRVRLSARAGLLVAQGVELQLRNGTQAVLRSMARQSRGARGGRERSLARMGGVSCDCITHEGWEDDNGKVKRFLGWWSPSFLFDYLALFALFMCFINDEVVYPFQADDENVFALSDPTIWNPVQDDQVTVEQVALWTVIPTFLMFLVINVGRWVNRKRIVLEDGHSILLTIMGSALMANFLFFVFKRAFRRPRPDLVSRCAPACLENVTFMMVPKSEYVQPEICTASEFCPIQCGFKDGRWVRDEILECSYMQNGTSVAGMRPAELCAKIWDRMINTEIAECLGPKGTGSYNAFTISEGFKSFPSGHVLNCACVFTFNWLYLAGKLQVYGQGIHLRSFWYFAYLSMGILVVVYVALSRISDYKHHPIDVLAGVLIGVVPVLFVYPLYFQSVSKGGEPLRRPKQHCSSIWWIPFCWERSLEKPWPHKTFLPLPQDQEPTTSQGGVEEGKRSIHDRASDTSNVDSDQDSANGGDAEAPVAQA
ncbi:Probable beta-D-xylosidase 2 (AtBXL2), partial [Durusdinium trenchii]